MKDNLIDAAMLSAALVGYATARVRNWAAEQSLRDQLHYWRHKASR